MYLALKYFIGEDSRVFPSQEFVRKRRVSASDFLLLAGVAGGAAGLGAIFSPEHPFEGALIVLTPALAIAVILTIIIRHRQNGETRLFNPGVIGDPVALTTGWGAVNRRWWYEAPWKMGRKLARKSPSRIEVKSRQRGGSASGMAGLGILFLLAGLFVGARGREQALWAVILGGGGVALFGVAIWLFLRSRIVPMIFDKSTAKLIIARHPRGGSEGVTEIPLAKIHAIQLIDKMAKITGRHGPRYLLGYEVNVVLTNGARKNVIDCRGLSRARTSAVLLAEFLDRPLWESSLPPLQESHCPAVGQEAGAEKRLLPRHGADGFS
jgi:hypothetical protein